jgi:lysozyme
VRRLALFAGGTLIGVGLYLWWRQGAQPALATGSASLAFCPSPPWDYWGAGAVSGEVDSLVKTLSPMNVSAAGRAAIVTAEGGMKLTAYPDPPGSGEYSIGVGHHGASAGQVITAAQGWALFDADIATVEAAINAHVTVPLSQGQFDALADFVFNEGTGHFESSTLLKLLNAGDYAGAAAQFPRWDIASGQVNETLADRRQAEEQEFEG